MTGAVLGVIALAVVSYVSHRIGVARRADASILSGFVSLQRPGLNSITNAVATLCNPVPYVLFAMVPVGVALARRRPHVAVMLFVILLGANETTELLKPLLAGARDPSGTTLIISSSFPSGHATAVMSLALTAVLCAPARRRPLVGGLMAAFAVAVCYSFLELGWHYPSDVLGGFLVAGTWTLAGIAALSLYEAHRPALARRTSAARPSLSIGEALGPPLVIAWIGVIAAALLAVARPHAVLAYAQAHATSIVGATAIAAASFALATGVGLMLRRPS